CHLARVFPGRTKPENIDSGACRRYPEPHAHGSVRGCRGTDWRGHLSFLRAGFVVRHGDHSESRRRLQCDDDLAGLSKYKLVAAEVPSLGAHPLQHEAALAVEGEDLLRLGNFERISPDP